MGSYLLLHWHAPDYHRHDHVLLLSSGRDQVVPQRTCHPITISKKFSSILALVIERHVFKACLQLGCHPKYHMVGYHVENYRHRNDDKDERPDFQSGFYHCIYANLSQIVCQMLCIQ